MRRLLTGYLHPIYAQSFAEFGTPRHLPDAGGWLLERAIPGTAYRDAMGCYPLFSCEHWPQLGADLTGIGGELVSVAMVTDPFGDVSGETLAEAFDFARPFKEHFIADLALPYETLVKKHHRYEARRALRTVTVEVSEQPVQHLDEWVGLYGALVDKHGLRGMKAFSRAAFERQLSVPGTVLLRALHEGVAVSAQIWFEQGEAAYYHLAASNEEGYRQRAAYALTARAIEYFTGRVKFLDIGAAAGLSDQGSGLTAFKAGWSSGTRPTYFCGKILNQQAYAELVDAKPPTNYFPAYRAGELS